VRTTPKCGYERCNRKPRPGSIYCSNTHAAYQQRRNRMDPANPNRCQVCSQAIPVGQNGIRTLGQPMPENLACDAAAQILERTGTQASHLNSSQEKLPKAR
jgi:hypothetical protein